MHAWIRTVVLLELDIINTLLRHQHTAMSGSSSSFTSGLASGLASYGVFRAIVGAAVTVCASLVGLYIGWGILRSPYTETVTAKVDKVNSDTTRSSADGNGGTTTTHVENVSISFTFRGQTVTTHARIDDGYSVVAGDYITVHVDPSNPSDVVTSQLSPAVGWLIIVGSVFASALAIWTARYLSSHRGAATAMGTLAAAGDVKGLLSM